MLEANYSTSLTGPLATFYTATCRRRAPNTLSQLTGEVATAAQSASFSDVGPVNWPCSAETAAHARHGGRRRGGRPSRPPQHDDGRRYPDSLARTQECACRLPATRAGRRVTAWAQGFGCVLTSTAMSASAASRVDMSAGGGAAGVECLAHSQRLVGFTLGTTSAGFGLTDL